MYRSPDDIALLTELAGVLDETIADAHLTSGMYLILREVVRSDVPVPIGDLAERFGADKDQVAQLCSHLALEELLVVRGTGMERTPVAIARVNDIEQRANEAIRAFVLDRPHSPTVYGLVAAMQSGRFTVNDLIDFIDGTDEDDDTADA